MDWYHYVQKIPARSHSILNHDYYYTIRPAIGFVRYTGDYTGFSIKLPGLCTTGSSAYKERG